MPRQLLKIDFVPYIRARLNDPNALLWNDDQIQQLVNQGEIYAFSFINLVWIRFAINIVSGAGLYDIEAEIPAGFNVKGITRITYRGFKVDMLTQRELALLSPVYRTQQSRPRWATWQMEEYNHIRLYPVPAEDLPVLDINPNDVYTDLNILNQCVVSAYIFPIETEIPIDPAEVLMLPDYFSRRLIKYFVLWKAYAMEGPGQNSDIATYFKNRLTKQINKCIEANTRIYNMKNKQLAEVAVQRPWKKFRPILPPNFGTPVNM